MLEKARDRLLLVITDGRIFINDAPVSLKELSQLHQDVILLYNAAVADKDVKEGVKEEVKETGS